MFCDFGESGHVENVLEISTRVQCCSLPLERATHTERDIRKTASQQRISLWSGVEAVVQHRHISYAEQS